VEVKIRQLNIPRRLFLVYRRDEKLNHAAVALLNLLRKPGRDASAGQACVFGRHSLERLSKALPPDP